VWPLFVGLRLASPASRPVERKPPDVVPYEVRRLSDLPIRIALTVRIIGRPESHDLSCLIVRAFFNHSRSVLDKAMECRDYPIRAIAAEALRRSTSA
jgi:hypothetical protein